MTKKKINAFATALIIFISFVGLGFVYIPMLMGYSAYCVETGSMENTIPEGSMVYVKKCQDFEDYEVGDIVTFKDSETKKSFTHRITGIDSEERLFETKGDANAEPDLEPTAFEYAVGKVKIIIPHIGRIASYMKHTVVKVVIAVIYIAWAAIEIELLTERKKRNE